MAQPPSRLKMARTSSVFSVRTTQLRLPTKDSDLVISSASHGIRGRWLSKEELLAQMSAIVLAATDTTSSALSRILHLLALHPDIQDKLRKELKEQRGDNARSTCFFAFLRSRMSRNSALYAPVPGIMRTGPMRKSERWLAPCPESAAKANIPGVYANTMTFMDGLRSCMHRVQVFTA
ncbi:hypothetical protein EDB83DRAFT_899563 [Lactarius deliciosus]|nr:hypothetical protein EDB83DRAFT_899563 [Lactarius deliciosus]